MRLRLLARPLSVLAVATALTQPQAAGALPHPSASSGAAASAATSCATTWTQSRIATGFGTLENLAFDGRGGMLLSDQGGVTSPGSIARLTPDGTRSTLVPRVVGPAGLVVDDGTLWFNSGSTALDAVLGKRTGTVSTLDLDGGEVRVVADRLPMPNGLARLADGSLVVSNDIGPGTMTRVAPDGSQATYAPSVDSTNGLALDADRGLLYVASTFTPRTTVSSVDIAHPAVSPRVLPIPGIGPLNSADDLALGSDGMLYVTLNLAGKVVRLDPADGSVCTIASGLPFVSSVRFGSGTGWDPSSLYAVDFLGRVTRLTPGR